MLQRPRPTAAAIHRRVTAVAAEHGWPITSYATVAGVVRRLDPGLVTLAHEGAKRYQEQFDLIYRREAEGPNAIWQADHTQLDLWVRDERDRPVKPWLTVILDDYSRAVAGFRVGLAGPSALQTALILRDAILPKPDPHWHVCGIPEAFYTDHGSDFASRHLEQVAADLKMVLAFSLVGQPRGRGRIERFFQTVSQLCLCTLPGYAPPGTPPPATMLSLAALDERLQRFLVEDYHQRVHIETGMAPQARWQASGFLPRLPASAEHLDLMLLTVATPRRVHPDGIHFQGLRYLDLTLAAYVGEWVTIHYDPRDLAEIRVFHDNRFLCRALCPELAGMTIGLKDLIRARDAHRRELRAGISERAKLVELLLGVHADVPTELTPPAEQAPPAPQLKRYYQMMRQALHRARCSSSPRSTGGSPSSARPAAATATSASAPARPGRQDALRSPLRPLGRRRGRPDRAAHDAGRRYLARSRGLLRAGLHPAGRDHPTPVEQRLGDAFADVQ